MSRGWAPGGVDGACGHRRWFPWRPDMAAACGVDGGRRRVSKALVDNSFAGASGVDGAWETRCGRAPVGVEGARGHLLRWGVGCRRRSWRRGRDSGVDGARGRGAGGVEGARGHPLRRRAGVSTAFVDTRVARGLGVDGARGHPRRWGVDGARGYPRRRGAGVSTTLVRFALAGVSKTPVSPCVDDALRRVLRVLVDTRLARRGGTGVNGARGHPLRRGACT